MYSRRSVLAMSVAVTWFATASAGELTFWSSARGAGGGPPHQIHQFDENGVYTGVSFDAVAGAQTSNWGYRDGAFDGQFMYFGWEAGVARHNSDGSGGIQLFSGSVPGSGNTWHALAHDPTGDGGNGSLWTASYVGGPLVEVDLSGQLLNSYPAENWNLYGLAYDHSDGNLWGHAYPGLFTPGQVVKINITTAPGTIMSGVGWPTRFRNLAVAGGLSAFPDGSGRLAAISQGTPDELGVYDQSGGLVAGPWDLEAQTFSNGHLGIAVVPEPGTLMLLASVALNLSRLRR